MVKGLEFLPDLGTVKELDGELTGIIIWQSPGRVYAALKENRNRQMSILLYTIPNGRPVEDIVREMGRKLKCAAGEDS
ncbi:MAG: hypothetical protein PHS73_00725 [Candidatus Peribacteraceae bacterium]|nr:hypothetical protein [Candidatus Peribacteraceae bacterium]